MAATSELLLFGFYVTALVQDFCITPDSNGRIPDCASDIRFPVHSSEMRAGCGSGDVEFVINTGLNDPEKYTVLMNGIPYSTVLNDHLNYAFSLYPTEPILKRISCNASDFDLLLEFTLVRRLNAGPFIGIGEPPRRRTLAWNLATYTVAIKEQQIAFDALEDWGEPELRSRLERGESSDFLGELVSSSEYRRLHNIFDLPLYPRDD